MVQIIPYEEMYQEKYFAIVRELWSDVSTNDLQQMVEKHMKEKGRIFLAIRDDDIVGFLNSSIRIDYVEGSDDNETGYIEGIFVKEEYRKQAIAGQLVEHLITYYKEKHITSIGSDAFVDNVLSDQFHKAVGFEEVSINRHYLMKIT